MSSSSHADIKSSESSHPRSSDAAAFYVAIIDDQVKKNKNYHSFPHEVEVVSSTAKNVLYSFSSKFAIEDGLGSD